MAQVSSIGQILGNFQALNEEKGLRTRAGKRAKKKVHRALPGNAARIFKKK